MLSPNPSQTSAPSEGPVTSDYFLGYRSPQLSPMTPSSAAPFLANERNRPFAEHQTDWLPPRQRLLWGLTILIMAVIVIFLVSAITTINNYNVLRASGVSVSANVINHYITVTHSKNSTTTTYSLVYQFTAPASNGEPKTYTATQDVYSTTYFDYQSVSSIKVLYQPGNPALSMIADDTSNFDSAQWVLKFAVAGEVLCALLLLIYWRRMLYWARLARDGTLITGVLTSASGRWISGKGAHYEVKVSYSFSDPHSSILISKKKTLTRNDLRTKPLPQANTPVLIQYLDEKHFELL